MKQLITITLCLCLLTTQVRPSHALFGVGDIVFDPTNHIQNVIQVLRLVEQLRDMAQNSRGINGIWMRALPALDRMAYELCRGQALAYCSQNLASEFSRRFPGMVPGSAQWGMKYNEWTRTVLDTMNNVLLTAQQQSREFALEDARLQGMSAKSESAVGRLQGIKTTNMMLAEQIRQMMQWRQVLLTHMSAQASLAAAQQQKEAQMVRHTRDWLGNDMPTVWPSYGSQKGMGELR